jgi:hypothetical protein
MVRLTRLYLTELLGHGWLILASSITTGATAIFAVIMGGAATDIVNAARAGITGWVLGLAAASLIAVPSLLSSIGVYTLVDSNSDILRYEAGLFASQGIARRMIASVWMLLIAVIPLGVYLASLILLSSFFYSRPVLWSTGILLPSCVSTPTILLFAYSKIRSILESASFKVMRHA